MLTPIETNEKLTERFDIRSGTIRKFDSPKEYGIVFSTGLLNSADDFDPSTLIGKVIESTDLRDSEEDRFFSILGGYYFERVFDNGNTSAKISRLFGIITKGEPGFSYLKEGGSTIIADEWEHKFPPPAGLTLKKGAKSFLDELNLGVEGWTFIVEPKDLDSKYPQSGKEIVLFANCPSVTSLSIEFGDCVKSVGTLNRKRKVTFLIETDEVVPLAWRLDYGDGSADKGQGTPPASIFHLYADKPSEAVRLTLFPTDPLCAENSQELALTAFDDFVPCEACPEIISIQHRKEEQDLAQIIHFSLEIKGNTPTGFHWTFGDGTEKDTTVPEVSHTYAKGNTATSYEVNVNSTGPEDCTSSSTTSIGIDAKKVEIICPEIVQIEVVSAIEANDATTEVLVKAQLKAEKPEKYSWNWGDGNQTDTTIPEASHIYQRPENEPIDYAIQLKTTGPASCTDEAEVVVQINPQPPVLITCPSITRIETVSISNLSDTTTEVVVQAQIKDGTPDKYLWDWGDGTRQESTSAKASHIYQRPKNEAINCPIQLNIEGPDNCKDEAKTVVEIQPIPLPPFLCRLFQYLIPFLAALLLGTLLVCYVAEFVEGNSDAVIQLAILAGIIFVGIIVCLLLWYKNYPPSSCDWLNIGWVSMLSSSIVSFYLLSCYEGEMVVALFFMLTAVFILLTIRSCVADNKARIMLILLAISLGASLVSCFVIGNGFLVCI